jgi:hypothetical protein
MRTYQQILIEERKCEEVKEKRKKKINKKKKKTKDKDIILVKRVPVIYIGFKKCTRSKKYYRTLFNE